MLQIFFLILLLLYFFQNIKIDTKSILQLSVLFFFLILGIVNGFSKSEFSLHQILRSQIWFFIGIVLLIFANNLNCHSNKISKLFNFTFYAISINLAFFLISKFNILNLPYINLLEAGDRVYLLGVEIFLPLLIVFNRFKHHFVTLGIALISGGKSMMLMWCLGLFKFLSFPIQRLLSKIVIGTFFLTAMFGLNLPDFLFLGDLNRIYQVESMGRAVETFWDFLFGIGIGNPYTTYSYYDLNIRADIINSSNLKLYINARYDVENGFAFLLGRFGILGTLFILILLYVNSNRISLYFFSGLFVYFMTSSPVGPAFAIFSFYCGIVNRSRVGQCV